MKFYPWKQNQQTVQTQGMISGKDGRVSALVMDCLEHAQWIVFNRLQSDFGVINKQLGSFREVSGKL